MNLPFYYHPLFRKVVYEVDDRIDNISVDPVLDFVWVTVRNNITARVVDRVWRLARDRIFRSGFQRQED